MWEVIQNLFFRQWTYALQIVVAEAIFAVALERKNKFAFRLALALIAFCAVGFLLSTLAVMYVSEGFLYLCIWLPTLFIYPICFKNKFFDGLFCAVAGLLVQNLSYNMGVLSCNIFKLTPNDFSNVATFFAQTVPYLAAHVASIFLCAKRLYSDKKDFGKQKLIVLMITTLCIPICFLLRWFSVVDGLDNYYVIYILFVIYDVTALGLLFGGLAYDDLKEKNKLLETLIMKENQYVEMNRRAIDEINIKSHDLKHYLAVLESGGEITTQLKSEIKNVVSFYDGIAKTGNELLDTILTEKSMLCSAKGIKLTYMIDAKCLESIASTDLVAMFSNILDNAINYLSTIEEEQKRYCSLRVYEKSGQTVIHADNYCEAKPKFKDGLPITTNADQENHGFGLLSIRHIARRYGGNLSIGVDDNMYNLNIIIPKNCKF